MNVENAIYTAVDTIVKNQNHDFDKTIQALVLNNTDPEQSGEIKVRYQDSVLRVYTKREDINKYPRGSHVYVLVPNGNMNNRKTIIGLVETLGGIAVVDTHKTFQAVNGKKFNDKNWSIELNSTASDQQRPEEFWTHEQGYKGALSNGEYCLQTTRADQKVITYNEDGTVNQTPLVYLINNSYCIVGTIEGEAGHKHIVIDDEQVRKGYIQPLTEMILSSKWLKITAGVACNMPPSAYNCNYGLRYTIYYRSWNNQLKTFIKDFDINHFEGIPCCQGASIDEPREQTWIFEHSLMEDAYEIEGFSLTCFVENFSSNFELDEGSNKTYYLKFTRPSIEAVEQVVEEEPMGLAAYITTPYGQTFAKPSRISSTDDLVKNTKYCTVSAILKEDKVQIDNSNLLCYWYIQDEVWTAVDEQQLLNQQSQEGNNIPVRGGQGWRLLNTVPTLTYQIAQTELNGARQKTIKLIALYKGTELRDVATLLDVSSDYQGVLKCRSMSNDHELFTYIDSTEISPVKYPQLEWSYISVDGVKTILGTSGDINTDLSSDVLECFTLLNENGTTAPPYTQLELKKSWENDGFISCDVYDGQKYFTTLRHEVSLPLHTAVDFTFNNREQVFLYDTNNKIYFVGQDSAKSQENLDLYKTMTKSLSITTTVSDLKYWWWFPKNNTLLKSPSQSLIESPPDKNLDYPSCMNFSANKYYRWSGDKVPVINFSIEDTYDNSKTNNNVLLEVERSGVRSVFSTDFHFVREGQLGTANTGYCLRIAPNASSTIIPPPTPIMIQDIRKAGSSEQDVTKDPDLCKKNGVGMNYRFPNSGSNIFSSNIGVSPFKVQLWKNNQKVAETIDGKDSLLSMPRWEWHGFEIIQPLNLRPGVFLQNSSPFQSDWDVINKCWKLPENDDKRNGHFWSPRVVSASCSFENISYQAFLPIPTIFTSFPIKNLKLSDGNYALCQISTDPLVKSQGLMFSSSFSGATPSMTAYYNDLGVSIDTDCWAREDWEILIDGEEYSLNNCHRLYTRPTKAMISQGEVDVANYYTQECSTKLIDGSKVPVLPPTNIYQDAAAESDGCRYGIILRSQSNVPFIYIPMFTTADKKENALSLQWSGQQGVFDEESNQAFAKRMTAGIRDVSNQLTGTIIGRRENNETGVFIYNKGNRVFSIDENGKVMIGNKLSQRLVINPEDASITTAKGLSLTYNKKELSTKTGIFEALKLTDRISLSTAEKDASPIQWDKNIKLCLDSKGTVQCETLLSNGAVTKDKWIFYPDDRNIERDENGLAKTTDYVSNVVMESETGILALRKMYVGKGVAKKVKTMTGDYDNQIHDSWFISSQEIRNGLQGKRTSYNNSLINSLKDTVDYRSAVEDSKVAPHGVYINAEGCSFASGAGENWHFTTLQPYSDSLISNGGIKLYSSSVKRSGGEPMQLTIDATNGIRWGDDQNQFLLYLSKGKITLSTPTINATNGGISNLSTSNLTVKGKNLMPVTRTVVTGIGGIDLDIDGTTYHIELPYTTTSYNTWSY